MLIHLFVMIIYYKQKKGPYPHKTAENVRHQVGLRRPVSECVFLFRALFIG